MNNQKYNNNDEVLTLADGFSSIDIIKYSETITIWGFRTTEKYLQ